MVAPCRYRHGLTTPIVAEQSVQPAPRAGRFLKSMFVDRGPVNRGVELSRFAGWGRAFLGDTTSFLRSVFRAVAVVRAEMVSGAF